MDDNELICELVDTLGRLCAAVCDLPLPTDDVCAVPLVVMANAALDAQCLLNRVAMERAS